MSDLPPIGEPGESGDAAPAFSDLPTPPVQTPPGRRGPKSIVVAIVSVLVVLVAGGATAAFFMLRGSGEELLSKVPGDADVVAVAYLDPSASQKVNLLRMAAKFPDLGDEQQLTQKLQDWLDQAMQDSGMTHDDLGWIGVEVAVAVDVRRDEDPSVALLVDSNDDGAAKAALEKLAASGDGTTHTVTTDGVDITVSDGSDGAYALFDGTVVIGSTQQAVENVIKTAKGEVPGIEDNQAFKDTSAGLPEGRLGLVFVNVQQLSGTFSDVMDAAFAGIGTSGIDAIEGLGMTLSAEPDGMAMDLFTAYDESRLTPEQRDAMAASGQPNSLLGMVPADAFVVEAVGGMDASAQGLSDELSKQDPEIARQLDDLGITGPGGLLSQLSGELAVEVSPDDTLPVGGALMVGTNDPSATAATIADLMKQLPLGGSRMTVGPGGVPKFVDVPAKWGTRTYRDVTINFLESSSDFPLEWAIVGDVAVLAVSPTEMEKIVDLSIDGGGITQDPHFTSATASVPTGQSLMFVDVEAALAAIRAQLDPSQQADFDEQVKNVAPVKAIVMGGSNDATGSHMRVVVQIP